MACRRHHNLPDRSVQQADRRGLGGGGGVTSIDWLLRCSHVAVQSALQFTAWRIQFAFSPRHSLDAVCDSVVALALTLCLLLGLLLHPAAVQSSTRFSGTSKSIAKASLSMCRSDNGRALELRSMRRSDCHKRRCVAPLRPQSQRLQRRAACSVSRPFLSLLLRVTRPVCPWTSASSPTTTCS